MADRERGIAGAWRRRTEDPRTVHVLVVEDDPRMGRLLKRLLEEDRHVVELATTAEDGIAQAEVDGLDVVILDVGLPDGSGLDVARALRRRGSAVAIIMLTARDAIPDRVDGLDAGADDYLVKPFAYRELAARLRALDRRRTSERRPGPTLECGPIRLDEAARQVTVSGRLVDLSRREFSLLEVLLRHAGQVLTRDQLLDHAWPSGVAVTPNAVDAYVHLLRTRLGSAASWVETVRGVGYRMRRG